MPSTPDLAPPLEHANRFRGLCPPGSQAEEEGLEGAEVAGFLFKTLMERKPEAVADLVAFQEHLLNRQTSAEEETLKVCRRRCRLQCIGPRRPPGRPSL